MHKTKKSPYYQKNWRFPEFSYFWDLDWWVDHENYFIKFHVKLLYHSMLLSHALYLNYQIMPSKGQIKVSFYPMHDPILPHAMRIYVTILITWICTKCSFISKFSIDIKINEFEQNSVIHDKDLRDNFTKKTRNMPRECDF